MNDLEKKQTELQKSSANLIKNTSLINLLSKLGNPIQTGSSMTGLMVHPDIDFAVLCDKPKIQDAIDIFDTIFKKLKATEVKITDFRPIGDNEPFYYVGIFMPFDDFLWKIDATITKPGYDPSEAYRYLLTINNEEKMAILKLKTELVEARRYVGTKSQPPYTFQSFHVYDAVLKGHARTIRELENYYE